MNLERDVLGIGGGRPPFVLEHARVIAPQRIEVRVRLGAGIDPYTRAQNPPEESVPGLGFGRQASGFRVRGSLFC